MFGLPSVSQRQVRRARILTYCFLEGRLGKPRRHPYLNVAITFRRCLSGQAVRLPQWRLTWKEECARRNSTQHYRRTSRKWARQQALTKPGPPAEFTMRHVSLRLQEHVPQNSPTPRRLPQIFRNAGQDQSLFEVYAATVSPRISHRDPGISSSKTTPKLMVTSPGICLVQVTRPRIAYRRSGCSRTPTASPGTTFFRELNFPPVSVSARAIAGWRVFSSGDSVSNVE